MLYRESLFILQPSGRVCYALHVVHYAGVRIIKYTNPNSHVNPEVWAIVRYRNIFYYYLKSDFISVKNQEKSDATMNHHCYNNRISVSPI